MFLGSKEMPNFIPQVFKYCPFPKIIKKEHEKQNQYFWHPVFLSVNLDYNKSVFNRNINTHWKQYVGVLCTYEPFCIYRIFHDEL